MKTLRPVIYFLFGWYFEQFRPDVIINTVLDLDFEALKARGIVGLIFDLDNTLLGARLSEIQAAIRQHLAQDDFLRVIVTNMTKRNRRRTIRLSEAVNQIGAVGSVALILWKWDFWRLELKPRPIGITKGIALISKAMGQEIRPEQVAVIGDGLATDIRAGWRYRKRTGPHNGPLLVWTRQPLLPESWHIHYLRRPLERLACWMLEI